MLKSIGITCKKAAAAALLAVFAAAALFGLFPCGGADIASAAAAKTVRVGFFQFAGYHILDDSGRRSGYGYEFLQLIARYGDWKYEYLGYDVSYEDSLKMLENGQLDVVTSVSKTEEREEKLLFSKEDIGTNSTIFTVKAGNRDVVKGDYATYDGLKIGMLEGNSKNDLFADFAAGKFTYEPVYFSNEDELAAALQKGDVAGIVSGSLRAIENEWLMESLAANPFYICTSKSRPDLMEEIDAAIAELKTSPLMN